MKFSEYRAACMRTAGDLSPEVVALGLCGEAGEVADLVKKHIGHGHPLDRDKLIDELGDLLWYCAVAWNHPYTWRKPDRIICKNIGTAAMWLCRVASQYDVYDCIGWIGDMCHLIDTTIEEVAERNIAKLKKRYPDGFNTERSMNREQSNG